MNSREGFCRERMPDIEGIGNEHVSASQALSLMVSAYSKALAFGVGRSSMGIKPDLHRSRSMRSHQIKFNPYTIELYNCIAEERGAQYMYCEYNQLV